MMKIQDIYTWTAELADGEIITDASPVEKRWDLTDCVRFSMTPAAGSGFPAHEITGVPMVRRFCRGFHKHQFHRKTELPGKMFWKDGADVLAVSDDWRAVLEPGDFIGKGVDGEQWYEVTRVEPDRVHISRPYSGKSKPCGMFCRMIKKPSEAPLFVYLHCVVCRDFRVWINYVTGAAIVSGPDSEMYL